MQTITVNGQTVYVYIFTCKRCNGKYEFKSYFSTLTDEKDGECKECKAWRTSETMRLVDQGTYGYYGD